MRLNGPLVYFAELSAPRLAVHLLPFIRQFVVLLSDHQKLFLGALVAGPFGHFTHVGGALAETFRLGYRQRHTTPTLNQSCSYAP